MTTQESDWNLELNLATEPPQRIRLLVKHELLIGRTDPTDDVDNSLDLAPYRGTDLGVSRRHAIVRFENGALTVTDLRSNNGTLLNGNRLDPETPYDLASGDTLHIGQLQMTVQINIKPGRSAIKAKRVDLNLLNAPKLARGQRILVVEDDAQLSKLYQIALEKVGFSIQICRDVVSAIRVLNQNTPALIILDIMLPAVHGLELCRYIRRDAEYPSIPIVVLSALADETSVQAAMEAGADIYLAKPPDIRELTRITLAFVHKNEVENPAFGTKKLSGTASLDHLTASPRRDTLIFFVEGEREPIGVVVPSQVTLGRRYPSTATAPHVDLEQAVKAAHEKGVSRLHAVIKRREGNFTVEDLGSSNGTYVNGHSLKPNEPQPIANGTEIRLGDLRMHIYMLSDEINAPPDA